MLCVCNAQSTLVSLPLTSYSLPSDLGDLSKCALVVDSLEGLVGLPWQVAPALLASPSVGAVVASPSVVLAAARACAWEVAAPEKTAGHQPPEPPAPPTPSMCASQPKNSPKDPQRLRCAAGIRARMFVLSFETGRNWFTSCSSN